MNICMIHGSSRNGNSDFFLKEVKNILDEYETNTYTDIYLLKDLPEFCTGCMCCLHKGKQGGEICPHLKYTKPIREKLLEADGIVIASPVYALTLTARLKAFFDHFACNFMCHRPMKEMLYKKAFIITSIAAAGAGEVERGIKHNMLFLGIGYMTFFRAKLNAANWNEISQKEQVRLLKKFKKQTDTFYQMLKSKKKVSYKVKVLECLFRIMLKRMKDGYVDKEFWRKNGWLDSKRLWQ